MHKRITFAMLTLCPPSILHRKIIYNFVWIYLGHHCIRKLLVQWWPRAHRYTFAGTTQGFSNISGGLFFNQIHITKQSWLFLFNISSGVNNEYKPTLTGTASSCSFSLSSICLFTATRCQAIANHSLLAIPIAIGKAIIGVSSRVVLSGYRHYDNRF